MAKEADKLKRQVDMLRKQAEEDRKRRKRTWEKEEEHIGSVGSQHSQRMKKT